MKIKHLTLSCLLIIAVLLCGCKEKNLLLFDLTTFDSDMAFTTARKMSDNPEGYLGQMFRIRGQFAVIENDEEIGEDNHEGHNHVEAGLYFFVVLYNGDSDAQGIHFIWDNNKHTFPGDYPVTGSEIEIYGQYKDNGKILYIDTTELTVIEEAIAEDSET